MKFKSLDNTLNLLTELKKDGLVIIENNSLKVPKEARAFVRNICMAFDIHLQENKPSTKLFSMTV